MVLFKQTNYLQLFTCIKRKFSANVFNSKKIENRNYHSPQNTFINAVGSVGAEALLVNFPQPLSNNDLHHFLLFLLAML